MPQDQAAVIPGVHHPQFEDENPNFWKDTVSAYGNPDYVSGQNVENPAYVSKEPPAFIKQGLDMSKVTEPVKKPETEDDNRSIATTISDKPYEINVYHPEDYGTSVRNHELTHSFQFTRNLAPREVGKLDATVNTPEQYEYGWVQGLEAAQKNRKTVSDFNLEQQADMVADYKKIHDMYLDKAKKGTITKDDERLMYRAQKAYHPFVSQLAKMPAKKDQVTSNPLLQLLGYAKSPTIDTKPEAPGLPSYDTPGLGMVPADPLMGGQSQSTVKRKPVYDTGPLKGKPVADMLEPGNTDVNHRIQIKNEDGSGSSIFSVTVPLDKDGKAIPWGSKGISKYALIPGIDEQGKFFTPDGKKPKGESYAGTDGEDKAAAYYNKTGHHLGIFATSKAADRYAGQTHAYTNDGTDRQVFTPSYEPQNLSKSLAPKKKK
jgi:hypothetical protein